MDYLTGYITSSDILTSPLLTGVSGDSELESYGLTAVQLDMQLKCSGLPTLAEIKAKLDSNTYPQEAIQILKTYIAFWIASLLESLKDPLLKEINDGHVKTSYFKGNSSPLSGIYLRNMRKQAAVLKGLFNIPIEKQAADAGISVSKPIDKTSPLVENTLPYCP